MIADESASSRGFTLVEVAVATSILVIAMSLALGGFIYFISEGNKQFTQDGLDIDVQTAMERVKRDIRLSANEKMFFYPAGAGPYTAISLPLARDDDGDGAVDVGADGRIIWDRTLIYHVWTGQPNQLRLTTFDPRDNTLTDSQRQAQLNWVAVYGTGQGTHNGTNASTRVLFQNLFTWSITPQGSTFDGYATEMSRETKTLGSIPLADGSHTFEFTVRGKNASSSGRKIGLDTLTVSPSYGEREAEAQLPATVSVGVTPVAQYMAGGSWNGNYQLSFPATADGHKFTLTMENDRWEETNFRDTSEVHQDTTVIFDTSLSPSDFVVTLDGCKTNWFAYKQTGDANGTSMSADALKGSAVRVLLRGEKMENGNWIEYNGGRCRVAFRAGSGSLRIRDAFIARAANAETNTMNAAAGTSTRLLFGGSDDVSLSGGQTRWSDETALPIDKTQSYLVSFVVDADSGNGNGYKWFETINPSLRASYIIPASSSPDETTINTAVWSTRTDVRSTNVVICVEQMFATFPTNGYFTSEIFDTSLSAPDYRNMTWDETVPTGGDIRFKVRSGNQANLSDAADWSTITSITSPANIDPGDKRYVQYRASFLPGSTGYLAPKLRRSIIRWAGQTRMVDVGGTFTKGPDYGVFELKVDNQRLTQGVVINLQIYDYVRSHGSSNRVISALSSEVRPLNSGR